jgi:hypothetical protein
MQVSTTVWTRITASAPGAQLHLGGGRAPAHACGTGRADCDCATAALRSPAPGCRPARLRQELDALLWDDTPVPVPARAVAAARVFSEGNGYLLGQMVDRSA